MVRVFVLARRQTGWYRSGMQDNDGGIDQAAAILCMFSCSSLIGFSTGITVCGGLVSIVHSAPLHLPWNGLLLQWCLARTSFIFIIQSYKLHVPVCWMLVRRGWRRAWLLGVALSSCAPRTRITVRQIATQPAHLCKIVTHKQMIF